MTVLKTPNTLSWLQQSLSFFANDLERHLTAMQTHRDIVRLRSLEKQYAVYRPEYVHAILKSQHINYSKADSSYHLIRRAIGESLLTQVDHPSWLQQRRQLQPCFYHKTFIPHLPLLINKLDLHLQRWCRYSRQRPGNLYQALRHLFADLSQGLLFNDLLAPHLDDMLDFGLALNDYFGLGFHHFPWLPSRQTARFKATKATLEAVLTALLSHPTLQHSKSLVGALNQLSTELSAEERVTQLIMFIFTSFESAASALTFGLSELALNPVCRMALQDALSTTTFMDILQPKSHTQTLLEHTIDEILRLYPAIWLFGRRATRATQLGDYEVPAGTQLLLCPYATHRNPDTWTQPNVFMPTRFAQPPEKGAHIPFGAGPRACIGKPLALLEMSALLYLLHTRYQITILNAQNNRHKPHLTLQPEATILFYCETVDC